MRRRSSLARQRRGVLVVLFSLALVVVVSLLAVSIDIGYMCTVRTDLQRAVDSAALAGAGQLVQQANQVRQTAEEYVIANPIGVTTLSREDIDVQLGQWDYVTSAFQPNVRPFDTVRVLARRSNAPLFFAGAIGHNRFDAQAEAMANIAPRDIMLVLDYSGSMAVQGKIQALKDSVQLFLDYLQENSSGIDRIGFVVYSTFGELEMPLTHEFEPIRLSILGRPVNGFTNIGEGMQLGREEMERNARPIANKLMIVMTDGLANRPPRRDPHEYVMQEAQLAAAAGIPITAISFSSESDRQLMADVAEITGGIHFHVEGNPGQQKQELRKVFLRIARTRAAHLIQ